MFIDERMIEDLYAFRTATRQPPTISIPPRGTGSPGLRNFLLKTGDFMQGPIAFTPRTVSIDAGRIDISPPGETDTGVPNDSSYVLVTGQGTPDDLEWIDGNQWNGQFMILQGTASQVIVLKHATTPGTNGNIVTADGTDVTIDGTIATNAIPVAHLIFDVTVGGDGAWRVIGGTADGGGMGSQTPWLSDIDAAGFDLNNLGNITFNFANQSITSTASGLDIQADTGDIINIGTGGNQRLVIGDSFIDVLNTDWKFNGRDVFFDADDDTRIRAGVDDTLEFYTGAALRLSLTNTSLATTVPIIMGDFLDMNSHDIQDTDRLRFISESNTPVSNDDPSIFADSNDGLVYNAADSNDNGHFFRIGNTSRFSLVEDVAESAVLEMISGALNAASALKFEKTNPTPSVGQTLGQPQWLGTRTGNASLVNYGAISVEYEDVAVGTHSGSMRFEAFEGGSANTFMHFNDNNTGTLELKVLTDMGNNDIRNIGGGTISDATDIVTVDGVNDWLLVLDGSAPTTLKKVLIDDLPSSGGSQTPWLSDINGSGFNLNNVGQVIEQERTAGNMEHQFVTGAAFADNTSTGALRFNAHDGASANFDYAFIRGVMVSDVNGSEDGALFFYAAEGGTEAGTAASAFMILNNGASNQVDVNRSMDFINATDADADIEGVNSIAFRDGTNPGSTIYHIRRESGAGAMIFNTPSGTGYSWRENNVSGMTLDSNQLLSVSDGYSFIGVDTDWRANGANTEITIGAGDTLTIQEVSTNFVTFDGSLNRTVYQRPVEFQDDIGFFSTTPIPQESVASDTLANLYTALRNYGLIA